MFFQNLNNYVQFFRNDLKTTVYLSYKNVEKLEILRFHVVVFR